MEQPHGRISPMATGLVMTFRIAPPILDLQKEGKPIRSKEHLDFIRSLPCLLCAVQTYPTEAAHVNYSDHKAGKFNARGIKAGDNWTVPLCSEHHRGKTGQHGRGERIWWETYGIDPINVASILWANSGDELICSQIIKELT